MIGPACDWPGPNPCNRPDCSNCAPSPAHTRRGFTPKQSILAALTTRQCQNAACREAATHEVAGNRWCERHAPGIGDLAVNGMVVLDLDDEEREAVDSVPDEIVGLFASESPFFAAEMRRRKGGIKS